MFPRAFALSWIGYFGFYLCRKNFSVLMPYLKSETGMTSRDLATALFAYSAFYAFVQFAMGRAADKVGARWVAGIGMLVSAAMSSLMAWPAWLGLAGVLIALQGVNGAAQACGWPSVLKMTRDWFPVENRGIVLGWWSTHLVAGGFAGTWLAASAAEAYWTRAAKAAAQGYAPDCIVTPDQVGKGRPHPWMIFENLRCLDVYPPGACVKVGDTECDMQEALNAGLSAVGVCDSASDAVVHGSAWTRKMQQAAGAQVVLPTAPDLWAICEKL